MRGRGITYDTGFFPGRRDSRPGFTAAAARAEMRVIAEELRCTAVRVTGGVPERLSDAARAAAAEGLEVWFSPFPCETEPAALLSYFADCAHRAEELRRAGAEVVLMLGCELSLFVPGFIDGDTTFDRIAVLASGTADYGRLLPEIRARLGQFFTACLAEVRDIFGGRITYASGTWEFLDWTPFDLVAVDAYRDARNAERFGEELRRLFSYGKPVVVSEFGCCTYQGAGDRGGMGWAILTEDRRIDGAYVRDEGEQVRYLRELLALFEESGVDSAFWFTFAGYELPHHPADPRLDLDLASYGLMRVGPDGALTAKEAFHALAAAYSSTYSSTHS